MYWMMSRLSAIVIFLVLEEPATGSIVKTGDFPSGWIALSSGGARALMRE